MGIFDSEGPTIHELFHLLEAWCDAFPARLFVSLLQKQNYCTQPVLWQAFEGNFGDPITPQLIIVPGEVDHDARVLQCGSAIPIPRTLYPNRTRSLQTGAVVARRNTRFQGDIA